METHSYEEYKHINLRENWLTMSEGDGICAVPGITFASLAQCMINPGLFSHTQAIG